MDQQFMKMLSDRFGMFVHYGIYSALGGCYKGERVQGLGEWIQLRAMIPKAEYEQLGREGFCPAPDFAINLVRKAKAAGVRYIVLTAKHHDGFCLFKTACDGYNTYDYFGRDLCRELVDACRSEGLEVGFYYSHTLDWHEPNAGGNYALTNPDRKTRNRNNWDFPNDDIDFPQYFRDKCLPQVRELLTGYGDLKLIWFDFPHDITDEESAELRDTVKSLQPNCLINSRIGHSYCDYHSLSDNGLPTTPRDLPLECLVTLNDTWGYKEYDNNWKTPESVIGILCSTLSADSSLLLNVGPMANGSLTPETEAILAEVGKWTSRNQEAIYGGVAGNPFSTLFPWGYMATKGNSLFLYLKEIPEELRLSGLGGTPTAVTLLGADAPTEFSYLDGYLTFRPAADLPMPVYRIDFAAPPAISDELVIDRARTSLPAAKALVVSREDRYGEARPILYECDIYRSDYATHGLAVSRLECTHCWHSSEDLLAWDADFVEAGDYEVSLICAPGIYATKCADPETETPYELTVGELTRPLPIGVKESYRISATGAFNVRHVRDAGIYHIHAPGRYRVILEKKGDEIGIGIAEMRFRRKA